MSESVTEHRAGLTEVAPKDWAANVQGRLKIAAEHGAYAFPELYASAREELRIMRDRRTVARDASEFDQAIEEVEDLLEDVHELLVSYAVLEESISGTTPTSEQLEKFEGKVDDWRQNRRNQILNVVKQYPGKVPVPQLRVVGDSNEDAA